MTIFHTDIVILAAGASTRLGKPKQLLPWQGATLLQHTIKTALEIATNPVVVTGANADQLVAGINNDNVHVVFNPDWEEGIATSIRCGLHTLLTRTPSPEQVIFLVCDQPFVTAGLLLDLINEQQKSHKSIVASAYEDTLGIPALFDKSMFAKLLALQGDTGAKKLMQLHPDEVTSVPFPQGNIDVDTADAYENLVNNLNN